MSHRFYSYSVSLAVNFFNGVYCLMVWWTRACCFWSINGWGMYWFSFPQQVQGFHIYGWHRVISIGWSTCCYGCMHRNVLSIIYIFRPLCHGSVVSNSAGMYLQFEFPLISVNASWDWDHTNFRYTFEQVIAISLALMGCCWLDGT